MKTLPDREKLDQAVTRRDRSYFAADIEGQTDHISAKLRGRRVLVVGGGGSIGSATTMLIAKYMPAAIHVVDISENYLAELVRDLRASSAELDRIDFRALPIDYGGPIMERYLGDAAPYDVVLNFAALKHVRSEKDIYSLLQMLDTNIVGHIRFKEWLARNGHGDGYFAVSTDKAANPVSLMGASKRLMEDVVFDIAAGKARTVTSARFANVAFSNGSLLQGFLHRLRNRQPLAVPRETKRYFVSQREAGELCVLAAFATPTGHIAIPKMDPDSELQYLDKIAERVLDAFGLKPEYVDNEEEARRSVARLSDSDRWPVLLTPLDTAGEKPYEEFVGVGEAKTEAGLASLAAIRHSPAPFRDEMFFHRLAEMIENPTAEISKTELTSAIQAVLRNFRHIESDRTLDQRM